MEILDRHRRGWGYRGGIAHLALYLCAQLVVETIPAHHCRFLGNGYAGSFAPPRESENRRESKAAPVAGLVSWRLLH